MLVISRNYSSPNFISKFFSANSLLRTFSNRFLYSVTVGLEIVYRVVCRMYVCVCMYVCMYIYIYMCVCVCVCVCVRARVICFMQI